MDKNQLSSYFSEFEKLGESVVRSTIPTWSSYDKDKASAASEWCRQLDERRSTEASSKRDEREEQTLSIAREANRIASSALAEARFANRSRWKDRIITIVAIIIAAIAARDDIIWLISWFIDKFKTP